MNRSLLARIFAGFMIAALVGLASAPLRAQYNFVLAVDQQSHDIQPVGQPHVSGGRMMFTGIEPNFIYRIGATGTPTPVVGPGSPVPGGGATFTSVTLLS